MINETWELILSTAAGGFLTVICVYYFGQLIVELLNMIFGPMNRK